MIEFEKWCKGEESRKRYFHSNIEYEMAKAGWIAALKLIKRNCEQFNKSHITHCEVFCRCYENILEEVEEELNGDSQS